MAASISEEDFSRVQSQLIEFKASNYALEERCQKQHHELVELHRQHEFLGKEWQKMQKLLLKNKKFQDVKVLLQENESLQMKLQSQEDEFRLQNATLIQEMSSVLQDKEHVEKENKMLKLEQQKQLPWSNNEVLQMEVCRLEAENSVLKKTVTDMQKTYECEISGLLNGLRDTVAKASSTISISSGDIEDNSDVNHFQPNENEDYEVVKVGNGEVSFQRSSSNTSLFTMLHTLENKIEENLSQLRQSLNLQLELETVREEKNILRQQLKVLQKPFLEKTENLETTVCDLTEKLKRKQTSLLQLQAEKESMYNIQLKNIKEVERVKEQEIDQLKTLVQQLQSQFHSALKDLETQKERSSCTIRELELKVFSLQQGVNQHVNSHDFEDDQILQSQLPDTKRPSESAVTEDSTLKEDLQKATENYCNLQHEIDSLKKEKLALIEELNVIRKTADKRKTLLDEMAVLLQSKSDAYQQEILELNESHLREIESLQHQLEIERNRSAGLDIVNAKMEDMTTEVKSLECTRNWLERRLSEAEKSLENTTHHYDLVLARKTEEHQSVLDCIRNERDVMVKDLQTQLEISNTQMSEYEEKIAILKQEIKDNFEERKIHDKKGSSIVKDLKRQLLSEKRRAENLQERLQEFLTEGHSRSVDIFKPLELDNAETSSISSWSMMSGGGAGGGQLENKDNKEDKTVTEMEDGSEQDSELLIKRIAALQKENWILEERLNHLELSSAAMADDLVKKTSIIQYYCMEGRTERQPHPIDKTAVKKLVDFIKDKGDESLKDDVRKMQRMLEEMLTRNMNLEKDLETMSQEVVRLSKLAAAPTLEEKDLG